MPKRIIIVASDSIHSRRYINALVNNPKNQLVGIITNRQIKEFSPIPQLALNFSLTNLKAAVIIRKFIQQLLPDVVHIHQANSYAWHSLRAIIKLTFKPKTILTCWGSDVLVLPYKSKLMHKMVCYNLHHADIITTDSLYASSKVMQLLGKSPKPIETINFGLSQLPLPVNLECKEKIILSNRLHKPLYRIDRIIKAFAEMINLGLLDDGYRLVIAAAGELSPKLLQLADSLGVTDKIIFTGMIAYDELVKWYQKSRIFISIPESDGTASSLLEAMAYGCISVVSCLPANLEWILDQINGFIVTNPENMISVIDAAVKISNNLPKYQQLYSFNYELICQKASSTANLQRFFALYQ